MKPLALGLKILLTSWLIPLAAAGADATSTTTFPVSDLKFQRPASWEWVTVNSPMRKAQLKVPQPAGEAGEVVFFYFGPGNGGGTQANVERWYRQFQGSPQDIKAHSESAKAGDIPVTFVSAKGTYNSGMPGGPKVAKPGFALLGAILEAPAGHVFVRFTGPQKLVKENLADFKKMITGARR